MSRAERRQEKRSGSGENPGARRVRRSDPIPWVIVGVLCVALVGIWFGFGSAGWSSHPDPRPGINGETVVPAARYANYPRVSAVYAQAAEIASILDGLYCYCDCSRHSDHRSLLTCFETDHGAACDVCLTEATVAHRMTQDGRSLKEIREAIDEFYGN